MLIDFLTPVKQPELLGKGGDEQDKSRKPKERWPGPSQEAWNEETGVGSVLNLRPEADHRLQRSLALCLIERLP
jgi:hypothetical protein